MLDFFSHYWPIIFGLFERCFAIGTSLHALLQKRETRAVLGWVGLIWLSPLIGSLLYCCFGVNRIERKGERILDQIDAQGKYTLKRAVRAWETRHQRTDTNMELEEIGKWITRRDLTPANDVTPLVGGKAAYDSMLTAIDKAHRSISLCSYIFDNDSSGRMFAEALANATQRGVDVRILIDDVGTRYSKPTILTEFQRLGLSAATFLPTSTPALVFYANLRNHRKILVVDGEIGFTGGMNIREGNLNLPRCKHPIQDVHFRFEGPVVEHFLEVFLADWAFVTGEHPDPEKLFGDPPLNGTTWARGIPDGPDADLDNIRMVMLGAIAAADERVDIVTPYFLPDESIINSLNVAAMRGVRVRVLIPEECNIRLVQWASTDPISRILPYHCEVIRTSAPFDHSKIMLVDNDWTLIGSSNWDPRSLRLNFEFNVECYGTQLNSEMSKLVDSKVKAGRRMSLEELQDRNFALRIRDGIARLATPYL